MEIACKPQKIMEKKFENITKIGNSELFQKFSVHTDDLIREATAVGALSVQEADNEYTREIGRVGNLCAEYEACIIKANR